MLNEVMISGFLILTYDCNNRCSWCYTSPKGFKKEYMNFNRLKDYLKLMKSLGIKALGLLGGEPTLYPHLFETIELAKSYGFKITLYTNGRKLSDEEFVKKLKVDFVNFSIQGGSKHADNHDKIVNVQGAWKETKEGIKNCIKHKIKFNIQTVLTHTNLEIYKELIDEFPQANLFIYYRQIPPIINSCKFFEQKVLPNKDTKEIYKQIFVYAKSRGIRTYLFSRMPLCWWDEHDPIEKEIHQNVVCHCHILNGSFLSIDVDGKVLPCPQFVNLPMMSLIKNNKIISREEFLEEFKTGNPCSFRKDLTYYPYQKCKDCQYFGTRCTGGCPLTDFEIGPYC